MYTFIEEMFAAEDEILINDFKSRVLKSAERVKECGEDPFILRIADLNLAERYVCYGANVEELKNFVLKAYDF